MSREKLIEFRGLRGLRDSPLVFPSHHLPPLMHLCQQYSITMNAIRSVKVVITVRVSTEALQKFLLAVSLYIMAQLKTALV